jgi:hypothetical protein
MGLLMHHHISDVSGDLQANPRKLTTVALAASSLGMGKTPLVEVVYFFLALIIGIAGANFSHPVFWVTVPAACGCIAAALATDPEDIMSITHREYLIYGLIAGDAVIKTIWLIW